MKVLDELENRVETNPVGLTQNKNFNAKARRLKDAKMVFSSDIVEFREDSDSQSSFAPLQPCVFALNE